MTVATRDTPGPSDVLAANPRPTKPADLEVGAELGTYQGANLISEALERSLRLLLGDGNRDLTTKRVESMRLDYQVSACLTVLTQPMVRADWTVGCEDEDVADWTVQAYGRIHTELMRSGGRALWAGRSPNVLVWDYDEALGLIVTKIRDLPPLQCLPITLPAGDYAGILQNRGMDTEQRIDDVLQTLWLTEGMESGNLLGRPLLAAALEPYLDKAATRLFHARYLERFGEPVVVVRYPDSVQLVNQDAINAAEAAGKTPPEPEWKSNRDIALDLGNGLRHHSVVGLPSARTVSTDGKDIGYTWQVEYLEPKRSGGADFREAIEASDRAIARAMFIPDLTFSNSDSGAYALGREHRSVFDAAVEGRLDDYGQQISRHLLQRLVKINFGDRAPRVQLEFQGVTDTDRDKRWELATALTAKGALNPNVQALADDLGIPLSTPGEDAADVDADLAANPFSNVGLPALIAAGVISEQEARDLLGIVGTAPGKSKPTAPAPGTQQDPQAGAQGASGDGEVQTPTEAELAVVRAVATALLRGEPVGERGALAARSALGLPTVRERVVISEATHVVDHTHGHTHLAADVGDVSALPGYAQPGTGRGAFARELTDRERPMSFAKIESGWDAAEATAIDAITTLLGTARERVMAQVRGIMNKPTLAEVVAAVATLSVGSTTAQAKVWESLIREVWLLGLASDADQLPDYAESIPTTLGPEARAQAKALAEINAARHLASLGTQLQSAMLNAVTAGTTVQGVQAILSDVLAGELSSEAKPARLVTRLLSGFAMNEGRRDGVERGRVPLRGAQFSAILDRRTCALCERQDELVVAIESPDLRRFTAPLHHNCRCVWVWITMAELDFTPTWTTPPPSLVQSNGSLVVG